MDRSVRRRWFVFVPLAALLAVTGLWTIAVEAEDDGERLLTLDPAYSIEDGPVLPGTRVAGPVITGSGSGKNSAPNPSDAMDSAKSVLNFWAMSRESSRCCFWSSPTGRGTSQTARKPVRLRPSIFS